MNYKLISLSVLGAAMVLQSCQKADDQPMKSGIIKANMDTLVKPGDNFEAYVNGAWIKKTQIPADKSSYGIFDVLYDKSQEDVKKIIEDAAKSNAKEGSDQQKIGDFFASYLDQKTRDAKGIKPLEAKLKSIDALASYTDLATYFGTANRDGNLAPFGVGVGQDFKDPTKYVLSTWQGGIGLPEREYYVLTDAKSVETRKAYQKHIEKMFTLAQFADPAGSAAKILALETRLASAHMKKEDTRNTAGLYNKYETANLKSLAPDFDWAAYLKAAGMDKEKTIIVSQVAYTKALNDIIKSTPLDVWKTYLKWGALHGSATALTKDLDLENFDFYGKTLYGTPKQREQWRRGVDAVNNNLGEIVGKEYVARHFPPEAKERMEKLVQNLLKAYEESIKGLDWMSADTKKQALVKISKFNPKIGYPNKWKDYSALKIDKTDLYGNLERAQAFRYNFDLARLGKPVDKDEWGMTPQTINAYYNPSLNEIVFPAAILQPPFFDLNVDDAVNYGAIGAVIGHEIGHGFDDQGATFDGDGAMRDWWTPADLEAFKKRTAALVDQYNGFEALPGLHVNGAFTLGENIGDLGGLSIGLKAYKLSLKGKTAPVMDGFTGEQRVFLGWGQVWLNKDREETLRMQISADPHSPAKFRINGTVRNIPEFYEAFKVKPGDSLYLAPEKRVKIW